MNAAVPASSIGPSLTSLAATTALQDAILAGNPFILIPSDQVQTGPAAAAVFDAATATLATHGVVVVRIANPLAAPLSVGRVMLQITGTDDTHDDGAARVMLALAERGTGASHLVIAVNDADTLAPTALSFFQLLAAPRTGAKTAYPPPQVVFAGGPAFHALLSDQRFQTIRDALAAPRLKLDVPASAAPPTRAAALEPAAMLTRPPRPQARPPHRALQAIGAIAVALVLFVVLLFALGSTFIHRAPTAQRQDTAAPSTPAPSTPAVVPSSSPQIPSRASATALPATPAPALQANLEPRPLPASPSPPTGPGTVPAASTPQPEPSLAAPPTLDDPIAERARLRREFDAFLASRSPASRRTTPAERDRLFREYLTRRQNPVPNPGATSAAPTVLIRYLAASPPAEAAARRVATTLRNQVNGTDLQPALTVPAVATIRYFFYPDRPAALALAAATPVPGSEWQIEDATGTPARPSPGTLELWLPNPPPQ